MIEEVEKINAQFKENTDEFESEAVDPRIQVNQKKISF
jgi:hypothetical protein